MSNAISTMPIQKILQDFTSNNKSSQSTALKHLYNHFEWLNHAESKKIIRTLLNQFFQLSDTCRELVLLILIHIFNENTSIASYTTMLTIPKLRKLLASNPPQEKCEELRLLNLELLEAIVLQQNVSIFLPEIVDILDYTLQDIYFDIRKKSCQIVCHIGQKCKEFLDDPKMLLEPVLINVVSKRYAMRLEVIKVLKILVQDGDMYNLERSSNEIKMLLCDEHVKVRKEIIETLGFWGINIPNKKKHYPSLVLFFLYALTDTCKDIVNLAERHFVKVGEDFEGNSGDFVADCLLSSGNDLKGIGLTRNKSCVKLIKYNLKPLLMLLKSLKYNSPEKRLRYCLILKTVLYFVGESISDHLEEFLQLIDTKLRLYSNELETRLHLEECCKLVAGNVEPEKWIGVIKKVYSLNPPNSFIILPLLLKGVQKQLSEKDLFDLNDVLTYLPDYLEVQSVKQCVELLSKVVMFPKQTLLVLIKTQDDSTQDELLKILDEPDKVK